MVEFDEDTLPEAADSRRSEHQIATPASLPMSEMQMRLARENPRKESKVFNDALIELQTFPDYADEAYYSIPYKDKSDKSGKEKIVMVEGLSIKAAMSLARRWGNCANGARIADDRDDRVICQGMFFDYENNVLTMRDMSVSKFLIKRGGERVRLNSQRLNMSILAGQSKAVRNAILASLPVSITDAYFQTARQLVIAPPAKQGQKAETVAERIEKGKTILITKFGAKKEEVEAMISGWVADADGHLREDDILSRLIGLKNALKDGQTNIADAMGHADAPKPEMPKEKPLVSGPATPAK